MKFAPFMKMLELQKIKPGDGTELQIEFYYHGGTRDEIMAIDRKNELVLMKSGKPLAVGEIRTFHKAPPPAPSQAPDPAPVVSAMEVKQGPDPEKAMLQAKLLALEEENRGLRDKLADDAELKKLLEKDQAAKEQRKRIKPSSIRKQIMKLKDEKDDAHYDLTEEETALIDKRILALQEQLGLIEDERLLEKEEE
jgi:hypothetical protein